MRILSLLLVALFAIAPVVAQEVAGPDRDWDPIQFAKGVDKIEISDAFQVPRHLRRAIDRTGCRFAENFPSDPIQIIRSPTISKSQIYFALVPCVYTPYMPHQLYYFPRLRFEPILLSLPVLGPGQGISASSRVGHMRWNAETELLSATHGSDLCPSAAIRHIYVVSQSVGLALSNGPFVLTRVDWTPNHCDYPNDWRVLWEPPDSKALMR
jgi:hypothetical protein